MGYRAGVGISVNQYRSMSGLLLMRSFNEVLEKLEVGVKDEQLTESVEDLRSIYMALYERLRY